jgi:hypothetical protein
MPASAIMLIKRQTYAKRTDNLTKTKYVSIGFLRFLKIFFYPGGDADSLLCRDKYCLAEAFGL